MFLIIQKNLLVDEYFSPFPLQKETYTLEYQSNGFQTREPREVYHGDGGTHFPCFIKSLVSRLCLCGGTMGAAILPIQPIIRHFHKPNAHIQVGTLLPP